MRDETPIFEFTGPFGIPVQISGSLLMLVLIIVGLGGNIQNLHFQLIFVAVLVASIFLHELGHAWGCHVQGVPVRRIVIYGGGGFCEQKRAASAYQDELIVAMGPIVNLAIWAMASLAMPGVSQPMLYMVLYITAYLNLFLAIFNLLPVHPLDGGKLFQLVLMRFLPGVTATKISGAVGVVISLLWIPGMFFVWYTTGFILFFFPSLRMHLQMMRL